MIALRVVPDIPIPMGNFFNLVFDDALLFIGLSLIFGFVFYIRQLGKDNFHTDKNKGETIELKKYSYLEITIALLITLLFLLLPFFKFLGLNDF